MPLYNRRRYLVSSAGDDGNGRERKKICWKRQYRWWGRTPKVKSRYSAVFLFNTNDSLINDEHIGWCMIRVRHSGKRDKEIKARERTHE